jgi:hypothetical protein
MLKLIAAAGAAALGLGLITTAASASASAGTTKYQQTCLPAKDFGTGVVPAGYYRCYVNAIADGPVYIHAWSSVLKHYTIDWQYCINFGPGGPGTEQDRVKLPAQIEIKDPFCTNDYGFPRGLVSAEANLPAADVSKTLLWITTPMGAPLTTYQLWELQYGDAEQAAIAPAVATVLADINADVTASTAWPDDSAQTADLAALKTAWTSTIGVDPSPPFTSSAQQSIWSSGVSVLYHVANGEDNGSTANAHADLTYAISTVAASGLEY